MLYGHRRDVVGYAKALEQLDHQLLDFIVDITSPMIWQSSARITAQLTQPGKGLTTREFIACPGIRHA